MNYCFCLSMYNASLHRERGNEVKVDGENELDWVEGGGGGGGRW